MPKKQRKLNGAEALYGFAGWLTSRTQRSGPFSGHDDATQAADLVAEFCKANNLTIPKRSRWYRRLKHPTDKTAFPFEQ